MPIRARTKIEARIIIKAETQMNRCSDISSPYVDTIAPELEMGIFARAGIQVVTAISAPID